MINILFYLLFLTSEVLALRTWAYCKNLQDNLFHFSMSRFDLSVIEATTGKVDSSIFLIRFFHNKIILFFSQVFNLYLNFWDLLVMVNMISVVGFVFMIYGIYSLIEKRRLRVLSIIFFAALFLQLAEIFLNPTIPFLFKFILISLPYLLLSFFGFKAYTIDGKSKGRLVVVLIFLVVSVLWLVVFQPQGPAYCVKIQ